jgi:hypothetical protein
MKITIQGVEYTTALDAAHPLTIERKLNAPSICLLWLSLPVNGSLATPARFQTMKVTGDDGTTYFTGYVAVTPLPEYAGVGIEGPRYRIAIEATSDELLLDQYFVSSDAIAAREYASTLLAALVTHTGSSVLSTSGLSLATVVSNYTSGRGANWSEKAGQAASMARAAYRVINGVIQLASIASTVHILDESSGALNLSGLSFTSGVKRALANDVTVCGENEPVAYVTEYFEGDGSTTDFELTADPYFPSSSKSTIIDELFNESVIDQKVWGVSGGSYLTLGASGLTMSGGNGTDGDTLLTWRDPIEMGGTLLLEVAGVTLSAGSTGIMAGFFTGLEIASDCTAGFKVTTASSETVTLQPTVQGAVVGTAYSLNSSYQYTLRIRVYCPECERAQSAYYSFGDNGEIAEGGDWIIAPGKIQMEIQEFANGIGATPVILYDGVVTNLAGSCMVVPASSVNLVGSIRSVRLTNLGTGWVVSTPSNGGAYARRIGSTAESAECHIERAGKLVFYTGYAPASGELVAAHYRTTGRAVGRAVNTSSQTALAAAGSPSVAVWIGSVTSPAARSSADCRNAAQTIAQAAASASALWSGSYKGNQSNFATDVWPGDELQLKAASTSLNAQVVVRSVKVSYSSSYPDLVEYDVAFANDWADDLAIKTSTTVPESAWLPVTANLTVLANLNQLTVTAVNGSTVTVNTGLAPPTGGGFMAGEDTGLVMRGSEQNLTFSRRQVNDRFYIRMYDGSTPPNYSEFSTAIFVNLALSS